MIELVDFEDFNNQETKPENITVAENKTEKEPTVIGSYIIFATVDVKTDEVHWMDMAKQIIEPLKYKNELSKEVLDDFVRSLSYAFIDKEFPIINYSDHMLYAYKKHMDEEAFRKKFRWYFEKEYPGRKPLTQQQKEFYQSLLLTADDKCKEIKQFGEELLGYTLNVVFFDSYYWMVGTKENEVMDSKGRFWELGKSQEEAKEHLVKQYLFIKCGRKDLPYQYTKSLNEAYHYYDLFSQEVRSLSKKLKLDYKENSDLYASLDRDFYCDGGTNSDSILQGYWTHKMVKQELKKYKSSGNISKK